VVHGRRACGDGHWWGGGGEGDEESEEGESGLHFEVLLWDIGGRVRVDVLKGSGSVT
jgi:hypothetical protein